MMGNYCYLVMVDPKNNNYKYYQMTDNGNGTFTAKYGRVGARNYQTKDYPMSKWNSTYNSKVRKGYEDKTAIYGKGVSGQQQSAVSDTTAREEVKRKTKKQITDEQFDLWAFLKQFTTATMRSTFVNADCITPAMVNESERLKNHLSALANIGNLSEFNNVLMQLMAICPRFVSSRHGGHGGVEEWLAHSASDFQKIIDREDSLILTMKSSMTYNSTSINSQGYEAGYISDTVKTATDAQREVVMKHLPRDLRDKVLYIYRVIPEKKSKQYKAYCEKNDIHRTKLLWHGSRNENWLSIISTSLSLNPNAVITGKMFGNGIYFAPDAHKSWGYTSSRSAYWTRENSSYAIMGLYETAYGKPLDCERAYPYSDNYVRSRGYDCVHAHKGASLYRDEIIYYNEDAMCLQYLVVFKA